MSSLMVSRTLNPGPESSSTRAQLLEQAARAALNVDASLALTDAAWARARNRLVEFVMMLRAWDRQSRATEPGVDQAVSVVQHPATTGRPVELPHPDLIRPP
jgi:hypothetical protein